MSEKLLPCPFCGQDIIGGSSWRVISCEGEHPLRIRLTCTNPDCYAQSPIIFHWLKEGQKVRDVTFDDLDLSKWNTREGEKE
jgi:hypothetical protein